MNIVIAVVTLLIGLPLLLFGPRTRRPLAAVLSWMAPGSGHLLVGRHWRGGLWVLLYVLWTMVLAVGIPLLSVLALAGTLLVRLGAAVDAFVIPPPAAGLPALWRKAVPRVLLFGVLVLFWAVSLRPMDESCLAGGDSMQDTLLTGDCFLHTQPHVTRELRRGDVVTFRRDDRDKLQVLRIVAFPGERVTRERDRFYISGKLLDEPYVRAITFVTSAAQSCVTCEEQTIPAGYYLLAGDNRRGAFGSVVAREAIRGRVFLIFWSWDPQEKRPRYERIGRAI